MVATTEFWSIDHVSNAGITLHIHGKDVTFKMLTYRDIGDIASYIRSDGVRSYLESVASMAIPPDTRQRAIDLSTLMFGGQAQELDLNNPMVEHQLVLKSLLKSHPLVTDDEVDLIMHTDQVKHTVKDIVKLLVFGRFDFDTVVNGDAEKKT